MKGVTTMEDDLSKEIIYLDPLQGYIGELLDYSIEDNVLTLEFPKWSVKIIFQKELVDLIEEELSPSFINKIVNVIFINIKQRPVAIYVVE